MIQIFFLMWLVLAFIDAGFTYYSLLLYKKLRPQQDYSKLERNPLPRFFIKKLGLSIGIASFMLFMVFFISAITYVFFIFINIITVLIALGFLIGFYLFLIIFVHISNVTTLRLLIKPSKNNKLAKDVEKYLEYAEKRLSILERLSIKLKSQKWDDHKAFIKY